jgi:hypothetical protein
MKLFLQIMFGAIFVWMTVMTVRTSLAVSIWEAWSSYAANRWAVATLWDAYFGFLTFYLWVVYKERNIWNGRIPTRRAHRTLSIRFQGKDHELRSGDTVLLDSSKPHSYRASGSKGASAIVVTLPSRI